MGVTIETSRTAANVGVGNQDFTADLGSLEPAGVLFFITEGITDGTAANNAILGIGAASSASDQFAACIAQQHNVNPTNTSRTGMSDECIAKLTGAGALDGEANSVGAITNGWRVNWGNALAAANLVTATFFAGTDVQADAGIFDLNAVQNGVTAVVTGFQPDLVFFVYLGNYQMNGFLSTFVLFCWGAAIRKDPIEQACYGLRSDDNVAGANVDGRITNSYVLGRMSGGGAFSWAGEVTAFNADGFDITTRLGNTAAPNPNRVGYLAVSFGGAADYSLDIIDTPTVAGVQNYTEPGFTPQAVIGGLTHMEAIDTAYNDGRASAIGADSFTDAAQFSNTTADESGANPTDTQSLSDDVAANLPQDTGAVGHVATWTQWLPDQGWTLNFANTLGTAKKWWMVAVEETEVPVPEPVPVLARNLMYIEQVTFREPYTVSLVGGDDERLEVFLAQRGLPGL